MAWVYDVVYKDSNNKIVAVCFHPVIEGTHPVCVSNIEDELEAEGNLTNISTPFKTLRAAQKAFYKDYSTKDFTDGLD